jgi:hypothetical protein
MAHMFEPTFVRKWRMHSVVRKVTQHKMLWQPLILIFRTQVEIVIAYCIIHNWVIEDRGDEFIIPKNEDLPTISHQRSSHGQTIEHAFMVNFRQEIANQCGKNTYQIHEHYVTYVPCVFVMNLCTLCIAMNLLNFAIYVCC